MTKAGAHYDIKFDAYESKNEEFSKGSYQTTLQRCSWFLLGMVIMIQAVGHLSPKTVQLIWFIISKQIGKILKTTYFMAKRYFSNYTVDQYLCTIWRH